MLKVVEGTRGVNRSPARRPGTAGQRAISELAGNKIGGNMDEDGWPERAGSNDDQCEKDLLAILTRLQERREGTDGRRSRRARRRYSLTLALIPTDDGNEKA